MTKITFYKPVNFVVIRLELVICAKMRIREILKSDENVVEFLEMRQNYQSIHVHSRPNVIAVFFFFFFFNYFLYFGRSQNYNFCSIKLDRR